MGRSDWQELDEKKKGIHRDALILIFDFLISMDKTDLNAERGQSMPTRKKRGKNATEALKLKNEILIFWRDANDDGCSVTRFIDFCTLGNFSKPVATIILPKPPTFKAIFVKLSKSFIFLVKSFLGNFYRHLANFYWSHWTDASLLSRLIVRSKPYLIPIHFLCRTTYTIIHSLNAYPLNIQK